MDNEIYNEMINKNNRIRRNNLKDYLFYDFHLHDFFEVFFFVDVSGKYLIEKNIYEIKSGQLAITNTHEVHSLILDKSHINDRIDITFSPYFIEHSSSHLYDLKKCFCSRENGTNNIITLNPLQISEFTGMYKRLETVSRNINKKGNHLLKYSILIELLVFINNAFMDYEFDILPYNLPENLANIIRYINENISKDLSLETLGKKFYISSTYLTILFKKYTGTTIHKYIVYTRISYAKKLLAKGFNVSETYLKCGFSDYAHFIKAFKKITGVSPGRYKSGI